MIHLEIGGNIHLRIDVGLNYMRGGQNIEFLYK
jgi:hypothetical protein